MPIHNEEKYLPYSLPSVLRINPNEVILIFDNCSDNSLEVSKEITSLFAYDDKTVFKTNTINPIGWKWRVGWLRRTAFLEAENDLILNTDADIIINPRITDYFPLVDGERVTMIGFSKVDFPHSYENFMGLFLTHILRYKGFTQTYFFSRRAWLKTDELKTVKAFRRGEDTHMRIAHGDKYRFCRVSNYNLRPKHSGFKGSLKWTMQRQPLWKAIGHSILYLRPDVLRHYLIARG